MSCTKGAYHTTREPVLSSSGWLAFGEDHPNSCVEELRMHSPLSLYRHGLVRSAACLTAGSGVIHGEPRLEEILVDPIILALLRSDGISLDDVIHACEIARREMKRARAS